MIQTLADIMRGESLSDPAFRAVLADWLRDQGRDEDVEQLLGLGDGGPVLAWMDGTLATFRDARGGYWYAAGGNQKAWALQRTDALNDLLAGTAVGVIVAAKKWGGKVVMRLTEVGDGRRFTNRDGTRLISLDGFWY